YNNTKTDNSFGDVLELLKGRPVYLKEGKTRASKIHFEENPLNLLLDINRSKDSSSSNKDTPAADLSLNFLLQNENGETNVRDAEVVCLDPCWIYNGSSLSQVKGSDWACNFFLSTSHEDI